MKHTPISEFIYYFSKFYYFSPTYYFPTQNLLFLTILWFHWAVFWLCVVVSVPLQFVQLHSKRLMAGMKRAKNGSLTHQGPHADCLVAQFSRTQPLSTRDVSSSSASPPDGLPTARQSGLPDKTVKVETTRCLKAQHQHNIFFTMFSFVQANHKASPVSSGGETNSIS